MSKIFEIELYFTEECVKLCAGTFPRKGSVANWCASSHGGCLTIAWPLSRRYDPLFLAEDCGRYASARSLSLSEWGTGKWQTPRHWGLLWSKGLAFHPGWPQLVSTFPEENHRADSQNDGTLGTTREPLACIIYQAWGFPYFSTCKRRVSVRTEGKIR